MSRKLRELADNNPFPASEISRRSFVTGAAAAGTVIGIGGSSSAQQDENGGTEPTADVTFEDQIAYETMGSTITVQSVTMSDGGFVAIHDSLLLDGFVTDSVIGVSEKLEADTHENVEVELFTVLGGDFTRSVLTEDQTLIAMPHLDTNDNDTCDFLVSAARPDGPYMTDQGEAVTDEASITVCPPPTMSAPYGLNTGGYPEGADPVVIDGLEFDAEPNESASVTPKTNEAATDEPIAGTEHDALYQTEHWGEDLKYNILIEDGTYDVTLHFAENVHEEERARVFDVSVQGDEIFSNLDIYAEVGINTALIETISDVEVTDGELTISTNTVADNTKFSGIEIREA